MNGVGTYESLKQSCDLIFKKVAIKRWQRGKEELDEETADKASQLHDRKVLQRIIVLMFIYFRTLPN